MHGPFDSLLIANRGEIAVRIIRAAKELGLRTIALYGSEDRDAMHVALADEAYWLGDEADGIPYLQIPRILAVAAQSGAQAVHPGYGFLAERPDFARQVIDAGLVWVGPPPHAMVAMAEKDTAKNQALALGIAVVPGVEGRNLDAESIAQAATALGFPLLIKAVAGGGGRGMRVVTEPRELLSAWTEARQEAANAFGDDALLLERFVASGRHIEVQVLCDHHGKGVHLFERECSVQRRHQKLIEESPSPGLSPQARDQLCNDALKLVSHIGYAGAGTVEFLVDDQTGEAYFLEVNARIQVEHPVTELVTGIDLVVSQLRIAMGQSLWLTQSDITQRGHAIEARLCAEDARDDHRPQAGEVRSFVAPDGVRVDTALLRQDRVSVYYDSMVAKLIAFAPDRDTAIRKLHRGLDATELLGLTNNRAFLMAVLDHPDFRAGRTSTQMLQRLGIAAPQEAMTDPWFVAAALVRHGSALQSRFRSNPWRADVTVIVTPAGDEAHVFLEHAGGKDWLFSVDHQPDDALMTPIAPTGQLRWLADGDGWIRLEVQGRVQTYRVREDGEQLWIQRPGHDAEALIERSLLPVPAPPELPVGAIIAPSAAMVGVVHVDVGDAVTAGQPLVTLEAMKMLTVLRAPTDGTVTALHCTDGDNVAAGQVLVAL
ncbi:MAG: biotin/lipoyl-binding protein [Myxococcales bacterium]|nr:biotin/lipoyl-binding protein [Myxococcales bacterium]